MPRSLTVVPFREVRHDRPDDGVYYEPLELRGRQHDWTVPVHYHDALHQFSFVTHGGVVATIDGVRHCSAAPAVRMVAPRAMHGFVYEPESAGHQVTVPTPLLQAAFTSSPALLTRLACSTVIDGATTDDGLEEVLDLFEKVAREFAGSRPGRAEALRGHTMLLALWFARREPELTSPAKHTPCDTLVERYRALIEQRFRAHWPVRRYAAALGVTPDHLSRRCRVATGLSAFDLAEERLIVEARRMLAYTHVPVAEIGYGLGFDDPGYFSRVFAKRVGQSPLTYRVAVADGLAMPPPQAAS